MSTALLHASAPLNGGSGSWGVVTGSGTIVYNTADSTLVTGLSYGGNLFSWTVNSQLGICPATVDTVSVIRHENQSTIFFSISAGFSRLA
jgi:hypothetical protein